MDAKKEVIRPRYAPGSISPDSYDTVATLEQVMAKSVNRMGVPLEVANAIFDSRDCPGASIDDSGNVIGPAKNIWGNGLTAEKPEPRNQSEAEANDPMLVRHDCTHGCGVRATVQPINSSGVDWQCESCGKYYKMQ